MDATKAKKFTYFIGIDVSKNELDYAVMHGRKFLFHKEAKNEPNDILSFISELKQLPGFTLTKSVFCMEHTGIYCNHLLTVLKRLKGNVVAENSLEIRNSLGVIRGKYDKIDAIRIANYAYKNREDLKVREFKRPVIIQLSHLFALRNRLTGVQMALRTPLSEQSTFVRKGIQKTTESKCKGTLIALDHDLKGIENAIDELIKSDERLRRMNTVITSIPNVGRILAIQIIISTNEFRDINNPKKFACYAGVAPFKKESGTMKSKARLSHIANKKVKALLHICAIGSTSRNGDLRDYYQRKVAEGKPKMAVINAIRYKLILRIFACLNQDRLYEKDYPKQQINDITAGTNLKTSKVIDLMQDSISAVTI